MTEKAPKAMKLVANRLAQMFRVHPQQDNSKVCSECKERVGVYPTGQRALKKNPNITIICSVCAMKEHDAGERPTEIRPAGSWSEVLQEMRDSKDVGRQ